MDGAAIGSQPGAPCSIGAACLDACLTLGPWDRCCCFSFIHWFRLQAGPCGLGMTPWMKERRRKVREVAGLRFSALPHWVRHWLLMEGLWINTTVSLLHSAVVSVLSAWAAWTSCTGDEDLLSVRCQLMLVGRRVLIPLRLLQAPTHASVYVCLCGSLGYFFYDTWDFIQVPTAC